MEYIDYEREYVDLWTTWIQLHGGADDEWFKIDRFKVGLNPMKTFLYVYVVL